MHLSVTFFRIIYTIIVFWSWTDYQLGDQEVELRVKPDLYNTVVILYANF